MHHVHVYVSVPHHTCPRLQHDREWGFTLAFSNLAVHKGDWPLVYDMPLINVSWLLRVYATHLYSSDCWVLLALELGQPDHVYLVLGAASTEHGLPTDGDAGTGCTRYTMHKVVCCIFAS